MIKKHVLSLSTNGDFTLNGYELMPATIEVQIMSGDPKFYDLVYELKGRISALVELVEEAL